MAVMAVAWSHWERAYQFGIPFGAGVQLFFVLSGFLITGILLGLRDQADRGGAIKAFYIRRALRIFPAFYVTLVLAWWADVPPVRETLAWHTAYLSNVFIIARGEWPGSISHFWSLAVEEQFYLVWPWLMVFAPRRWLMPGVVASIAIAPIFRWWMASLGYRENMLSLLTPGSLDALAIGAWIALAKPTIGGHGLLLAAIGAIFITPLVPIKGTLLAIVFGWIVWRASDGFGGLTGRVLSSAPVVYLGRISYGIYLAHGLAGAMAYGLFALLGLAWPAPEPLRFVILCAVTVVAAALSWHLMEWPINQLKRLAPYDAAPRYESLRSLTKSLDL